MQIFTADKPLVWGALDLPLLGISKDWNGRSLTPPAAFSLASDGAKLWFVATRQAAVMIHPDAQAGAFTPELWRYDVAELFIADAEGTGYLEFNLAPNGAWWACKFDSVRKAAPSQPDFANAVTTHHDLSESGSWLAAMEVSLNFLSEQAGFTTHSRANVTFMMNSPAQTFHSASELPGDQPDFHQPMHFGQLNPTSHSSK